MEGISHLEDIKELLRQDATDLEKQIEDNLALMMEYEDKVRALDADNSRKMTQISRIMKQVRDLDTKKE